MDKYYISILTYVYINCIQLLFLLCVIVYLANLHTKKQERISPAVEKNTQEGIKLPSAFEMVNGWASNIFFAETSSSGTLDAVQACAVESANRANPEWQVNVLFLANIKNATILQKLRASKYGGNIKYARLETKNLTRYTSFRALIQNDTRLRNNADVIRFLTLSKYGGVFLDLNSITLKPFTTLGPNWIVKTDKTHVTANPLAISADEIGKKLSNKAERKLYEIIEDMQSPEELKTLGNDVLTEALKDFCLTSYVPEMDDETCFGIQFYDKNYFPMSRQEMKLIFAPGQIMLRNAVILHLKHHKTLRFYNVHHPRLAYTYCPATLQHFGDDAFLVGNLFQ